MPPPTQRRMLANITQQADSQHNRELQHESEQQGGGAPVKPHVAEPTAAAAKLTAEEQHAQQMSYLQRQYHTAALSESIRSHNEYVQQHKSHQQQQQQSPTTPNRGPAGRGPAGRGGANNRRTPKEGKKSPQQSGGGGMAPHPNHADVDGYPCPCPDCNLARLQEAMAEGAPHQHQHQDSELAMLHAAHQHEAMAMQQHNSHHGYDAGYYGGGYPPYNNSQQQQQMQHGGPYRQHSPYAPVSVGYSPNNGYYGLQSAPNSPAGGGYDNAPGAASFDVPYIPAPRNNYARFAMAPEGTPSDEGRSPTDMAPVPQPQPQRKGRQAPPRANAAGKKDHAKLSPASQGEAMAFPTATVAVAPAAAGEEANLGTPMKKPANAKGARKASPTQDNRRTASPAEAAATEPRPPCPHALKVRCSPWHTRSVISPFAVAVGDCVVFEGDRGKDAGVVVDVAANEADSNATGRGGSQVAMALAHGSEADATAVARADEEAQATVDTAATLVEKLGLRMRVVGAVYQHDRQKLTFMYEASDRVDFRQLLRELYTEFRCRIWLEVPPGAHNPAASRAAAKSGNRSPPPSQQQHE